MGLKAWTAAAAVTAILLLAAAEARASTVDSGVVYLYSDPGDIPLYKALPDIAELAPPTQWRDSKIILALDLNYEFMDEAGRESIHRLLEEAAKGKTVVVGFNTLRSIEIQEPGALKAVGVSVNFTHIGVVEVAPGNGFKFEKFKYDTDVYGIALVEARRGEVLLSTRGIPVLIEVPIGRGRLVIVTINPSEHYLNEENPAVAEFVASIVEHYSSGGGGLREAAPLAALGSSVAAYLTLSRSPTASRLRDAAKWPLALIGGYLIPSDKALDNETRRAIYEYVKEKGYTTVADTASRFSISRTNARWHLYVLVRSNLLEVTRVGKVEVYHPPGEDNRARAVKDFLLENRLRRRIYELLARGVSMSELPRILGVSKSTVSYHVGILRRYGVLSLEEE